MPYDLFNPSTGICRTFSRPFFAKALELGRRYGWQPKETYPPAKMEFYKAIADWHGKYLTNDGQIVSAEDGHSLALALERALQDIPKENQKFDWYPRLWKDDNRIEWLSPEEREFMEEELQHGMWDVARVHPLAFFAGGEEQSLMEFIRFCRLGSFLIL